VNETILLGRRFDLMEPLRPIMDTEVLEFALEHTFAPGDFTIANEGGHGFRK
jgi:hypothetical protein